MQGTTRYFLFLLAIALLLGGATRLGAEEGDEPSAPLTSRQAADKFVELERAGDAAVFSEYAKGEWFDPWVVVDELCARSKYDLALKLAGAAREPLAKGLGDYVETRRGRKPDARARKGADAAEVALAVGDWAAAAAALEGIPKALDPSVLSLRLGLCRGQLLAGTGRLADAARLYGRIGVAARELGWRARAAFSEVQYGWALLQMGAFKESLAVYARAVATQEELGLHVDAARAPRRSTFHR